MRKAAPRVRRWCRRGRPEASSADTRVVSTASWTPSHNGIPFAITSRRRSSWRCAMTLRSRSKTLAATVAPASRQSLAVARSKGTPREHVASNHSLGAFSTLLSSLVSEKFFERPGARKGAEETQKPRKKHRKARALKKRRQGLEKAQRPEEVF